MDKPTVAQCIQKWHFGCSSVSAHVSFHLRLAQFHQAKKMERKRQRGGIVNGETKRIAASYVDSFSKAILTCLLLDENERTYFSTDFPQMHGNFDTFKAIKIRTIGHRKLVPTGFNSNVLASDNPRRPSSTFDLSMPLSTCPSFTKQEMRKRSTWKLKISRNSKKVFAGSRRSNEKCVIAATAS